MRQTAERSAYIEDAEAHNSWWDGDVGELERAVDLPFRSDYFTLLLNVARWQDSDIERALLPYSGQKGIGKTTMLKQVIGTLIDGPPAVDVRDDQVQSVAGTVPPRQVLYVPIEQSLYELEDPETAREELHNVVRYFHSHVAQPQRQTYVIVDDLGALDIEGDPRDGLLDIVDDSTYLIVASDLQSEVDFASHVEGTDIAYDETQYPISLQPIKFVDYVRMGCEESDYEEHNDLIARIGADRSYRGQSASGTDTENPIGDVRRAFADGDGPRLVSNLETLYFDCLSPADHSLLGNLRKAYVRDGGLLYQPQPRPRDEESGGQPRHETVNELIRTNLQLTMFKSIGPHNNIKQPRNLLRLAALAARKSPPTYRYTDIADLFGVDRRTVDRYLDALEGATLLAQSREFSLTRHRSARLYLGDPRYVTLLSQRADHDGFQSVAAYERVFAEDETGHRSTLHVGNPAFERALALTAGFDHAYRLSGVIRSGAYQSSDAPRRQVEHHTIDDRTIDFVVHDRETVYPFVLDYQPETGYAADILDEFDPTVGAHQSAVDEGVTYTAPYRFVLTDDYRQDDDQSLTEERDGFTLVRLPFWLFLLVC